MAFRECNLLVVDADMDIRKRVAALVDGLGVGVSEAETRHAALAAARDEDWLMVVIGVDPREPASFDLARELRGIERCRRTPMLFVTGQSVAREDLRYAYGLGALDVLTLRRDDEDLLRQRLVTYIELFRQQVELEHLLDMVQAENRTLYEENETYRREQSDVLRRATHDVLTGLPNRLLFDDRLDAAIQRAQRRRGGFAVLFADVDDLKTVNDRLGHRAGDALLVAVARRLSDALRASDTVGRLGGDEFGIVLEDIASAQAALDVADKLVACVGQPLQVDAMAVGISERIRPRISIGVALYPDHGLLRDELLMLADLAMYRTKRAGGGSCALYEASGRH